jgi:hypothetical protein
MPKDPIIYQALSSSIKPVFINNPIFPLIGSVGGERKEEKNETGAKTVSEGIICIREQDNLTSSQIETENLTRMNEEDK